MPRVCFGEPEAVREKTFTWWHIPISLIKPRWYEARVIRQARLKLIIDGSNERTYALMWATNDGPVEHIDLHYHNQPGRAPVLLRSINDRKGVFVVAKWVQFILEPRRVIITDLQTIRHQAPQILSNDGTGFVHHLEFEIWSYETEMKPQKALFWLVIPKDGCASNDRFQLYRTVAQMQEDGYHYL